MRLITEAGEGNNGTQLIDGFNFKYTNAVKKIWAKAVSEG